MTDILAVLRQDHANMARLLDALDRQIAVSAAGRAIDLDIVGAIADYVLEYPDRFHHPVEDMVLDALRQRDAAAAKPLEGLEREHQRIGNLSREFHAAVGALRADEPARREDFLKTARAFVAAMRDHVAREDNDLFSAAEATLTADDLEALAGRLPGLDDPLFGAADRASYLRLRQDILDWSDSGPNT